MDQGGKMTDEQFRIMLAWFMVSDPWPLKDQVFTHMVIEDWLNLESKKRGYIDWIDAYHKEVR
jgi:hypothetical protein